MGLDMFLYKAKRPEYQKDDEFISKKWLLERGFSCILKEDINDSERCLLPYCREDAVMVDFHDMRQIMIDYGCNPDKCKISFSYRSNKKIGLTIYKNNEIIKEIQLTNEELDEKYKFESLEEVYVVKLEEVGYWRKAYDLQEYIYSMLDYNVDDCEYKKLSKEQVLKILDYDDSGQVNTDFFEDESEDCAYFYYEWY